MKSEFSPVEPRACPHKEDCLFYHSATYPDGSTIDGVWDIRGVFEQYIGNYPLKGKTVLDVGTATGFFAFEAERAGAASVTALDAFSASEFERVPFATIPHHLNRRAYDDQMEAWYGTLKNGFWYSWNKNRSSVEMIYAPLARLPYWERKFDVVIAGAILEHLADPVSAIGNLARLAREAVIIGFTPVADLDAQFMQTANDWGDPADPAKTYTFWTLTWTLAVFPAGWS